MNGRPRLHLSGIVLFGILGCGGDGGVIDPNMPQAADPGFLNVGLSTPNANDGAILFTVSGWTLDSLRAPGFELFYASTGPGSVRALVAGQISGGTVARFWVPDRANVALYSAVLQQAAERTTYGQRDLSGYSLTVSR